MNIQYQFSDSTVTTVGIVVEEIKRRTVTRRPPERATDLTKGRVSIN